MAEPPKAEGTKLDFANGYNACLVCHHAAGLHANHACAGGSPCQACACVCHAPDAPVAPDSLVAPDAPVAASCTDCQCSGCTCACHMEGTTSACTFCACGSCTCACHAAGAPEDPELATVLPTCNLCECARCACECHANGTESSCTFCKCAACACACHAAGAPKGPTGTAIILTVNDKSIMKIVLKPGFDWRKVVRPKLPGNHPPAWCPRTHFGYLKSGTVQVNYDDGTSTRVNAGDEYCIKPGHLLEVVGADESVMIEFST